MSVTFLFYMMTFYVNLIFTVECLQLATGDLRQLLNKDYIEAEGQLLIYNPNLARRTVINHEWDELRLTIDEICIHLIFKEPADFQRHDNHENVILKLKNASDIVQTLNAASSIQFRVGHVVGNKNITSVGIITESKFTGHLYDNSEDEVTIYNTDNFFRLKRSTPVYILRRQGDVKKITELSCETAFNAYEKHEIIGDAAEK